MENLKNNFDLNNFILWVERVKSLKENVCHFKIFIIAYFFNHRLNCHKES